MMPAIERTPRSERTSDPAHSADAAARVQHDVICISSIDWDFIWQGHQEIMSTLAAQGHRVLFVENTGVRAPKLRDMPRRARAVSGKSGRTCSCSRLSCCRCRIRAWRGG
jgi:hypothetical protein